MLFLHEHVGPIVTKYFVNPIHLFTMKVFLRNALFTFPFLLLLGDMLAPGRAIAQCTPPVILSKKDSNRCGPGPVELKATASGGVINWYANSTGGSPLGTGGTFTTPSISATTNYYVAAATTGSTITNASIATLTGGGNGCSGGVMFNITPTVNITVDSFLNLSNSSQTTTVTVYYKTGTYAGFETNASAWTTLGSTTITTTSGSMAKINVGTGLAMTAGTLYAVYIANMSNGYTDGNSTNLTYTNADLTLNCGSGLCGVFTGNNNPRVFNGTVYYHKGSGCESARQTVVATVKPLPSVNLGNDTTICPGITYTFNAGNPGATYAWNTGATTQSINVSAAGTYSVLVTAANGCANSDAVNITAGVVPVNNLPATTNLCAGSTASLNAGNTGSTFHWTPGNATTQFINVTNAGTYTAQVKSVNGCIINSSTNVVIRPLPVAALGNDTSICNGAQIVLNAGNPGYSYLWNTNDTTQTIAVSDSGTYTVTVTTPYNCVNTEDKHIAYLPSPRVEGFNFIPLFYENLGKVQFSPLNPTHVNSYEWDFGDGSPLSTQVNPMHIYTAGGHYEVSLKVYNGCGNFTISLPINVDLVTGIVTLNKDAADVALYPNPSRDYITIDNKSKNLKMEQVMVFSTLGTLVYQQKADNAVKHHFTVSHLASGIYTVRILTDKGFVIRKLEILK